MNTNVAWQVAIGAEHPGLYAAPHRVVEVNNLREAVDPGISAARTGDFGRDTCDLPQRLLEHLLNCHDI